jgi:hypothetical protein
MTSKASLSHVDRHGQIMRRESQNKGAGLLETEESAIASPADAAMATGKAGNPWGTEVEGTFTNCRGIGNTASGTCTTNGGPWEESKCDRLTRADPSQAATTGRTQDACCKTVSAGGDSEKVNSCCWGTCTEAADIASNTVATNGDTGGADDATAAAAPTPAPANACDMDACIATPATGTPGKCDSMDCAAAGFHPKDHAEHLNCDRPAPAPCNKRDLQNCCN